MNQDANISKILLFHRKRFQEITPKRKHMKKQYLHMKRKFSVQMVLNIVTGAKNHSRSIKVRNGSVPRASKKISKSLGESPKGGLDVQNKHPYLQQYMDL